MSTHKPIKCYSENKLPKPLFYLVPIGVLIGSLISIAVIPSVMNAYEQHEMTNEGVM